MLENISGDTTQFNFTLEERELKRKLANEARRAVNKMNIPEAEKIEMKDICFNDILAYENKYRAYQKTTTIKNLSMLN